MSYTIDTAKKLPALCAGVGFSIPASGKKSHLVFIDSWGEISPACGSGLNIAGYSARKPSSYKINTSKEIAGDNLCSKCLKNDYIKELN
jgi:hypothetical protein